MFGEPVVHNPAMETNEPAEAKDAGNRSGFGQVPDVAFGTLPQRGEFRHVIGTRLNRLLLFVVVGDGCHVAPVCEVGENGSRLTRV